MERPEIWGHLADAPDILEKVRVFKEMIPGEVETIVDVGCGDGAITNALGRHWAVTGVDSSAAALEHVTTPAVLADARELPFEDASFDLAMTSQMLEHLDDAAYGAALGELGRVARDHVLISVPYREDLDMRMIRCPRCGLRQHVWGHMRRFTRESLTRDLVGFEPVDTRIFGDLQDPAWPKPLLWVAHKVFRAWYPPEGQHPQCSGCGNTDFTAMRRLPPYLDLTKKAIDRVRFQRRVPFWLGVLARRRPRALPGNSPETEQMAP
jgi:SAM-dependent methyltransferase